MSVRLSVRRQNVRSAKCLSAKCLSAKCLSAKCPGTELSMLIDEADSANTKKQISYAVKRMKMFASSAGVPSIGTMNQTVMVMLWFLL